MGPRHSRCCGRRPEFSPLRTRSASSDRACRPPDPRRLCQGVALCRRLTTCDGGASAASPSACDAIASLILVLLGDALSDAGVTRSSSYPARARLRLRERRDTYQSNCSSLHRSVPAASCRRVGHAAPFHSGRFTSSSRPATRPICAHCSTRSYLSRQLDDLLDLVNNASPDGLKELGSVAMHECAALQPLHRGRNDGNRAALASARPFRRGSHALRQGFAESAGGYRLPFLARSPLLVGQSSLTGGLTALLRSSRSPSPLGRGRMDRLPVLLLRGGDARISPLHQGHL